MSVDIRVGDALEQLRFIPDESVHCCVTSPPYWGLRDYGVDGQIGLEETPDEWCAKLVEVFGEVRRVLRSDGTLWLNLGDSYAGSWGAQSREHAGKHAPNVSALSANQVKAEQRRAVRTGSLERTPGLKPKDLIGAPWMVAFALRADGWYLRRDIIWHKANPMPESVNDRPTTAHEYVFLLSKSKRYSYDQNSIREKDSGSNAGNGFSGRQGDARSTTISGGHGTNEPWKSTGHRNARSVWTIPTLPFPEAHFATFPPELARRCILAGCLPGGTVIDPFGGAGTTGLVADRLQRNAILIELNPDYAAMARKRIDADRGEMLDLMEAAS